MPGFIHLYIWQHWLSTCYVPGTVLETYKPDTLNSLISWSLYFSEYAGPDNKYVSYVECWKRISTIKNKVEKWEWGVQECGGRMFQGNPHWEGVSWTSLKERGKFCHEDTQGKGISQGRKSQCKGPMVEAYWNVWRERKEWVMRLER